MIEMVERVLLASPRGYCAGVERAVETVERLLDLHGPPIYVRKQIVHNIHVVRELEERGASRARPRCLAAPGSCCPRTASRPPCMRTRAIWRS